MASRPAAPESIPTLPAPVLIVPTLPSPAPVRSSAVPLKIRSPLPTGWISLDSLATSAGLSKPRLLDSAEALTYELHSTKNSSSFTIGSRQARVRDAECWLGFAPQLIRGRPFVHALDLQKNIQPLLAGNSDLQFSNRVVVIDPGHGGDDPGSKSVVANRFEKEFTLDWARRTKSLLEAHGWRVVLTRTNDVTLPLNERVLSAERVQADLFVSLHFNSAFPSGKQAGLETYCLTPAGMTSNLTRNYPDDPAEIFPNNDFDEQNVQLASRVHRSVLAETNRTDRGLRRARFMGVLRGHHRPAILIEGGYLSNPQEAELIGTPAFRQKLAAAVAHALQSLAGPNSTRLTRNAP